MMASQKASTAALLQLLSLLRRTEVRLIARQLRALHLAFFA